ncbi:hypothetical protein C2G38_2219880 [Gigaspora rosea]|uniref:Uncharacterized protein n=1 Tax=Gigaspora rosea TaxID=44941 RepID=A0A397U6J6_9GLOM|nr:hypothetical protein C2G38_2219880 [Gigaspora rosea]
MSLIMKNFNIQRRQNNGSLDYFNSAREFIEFIPFEKKYIYMHITRIVIYPISEGESFMILNMGPTFEDFQNVWNKLDLNEKLKRKPDSDLGPSGIPSLT